MTTPDPMDYVLADITLGSAPRIWNFYTSMDEATADQERANREAYTQPAAYQAMSWIDYLAHQQAHYGARPLVEITHARWDEMLNVLPPLDWHRAGGLEVFFMSEFTYGNFTEEFARMGDRYFARTVDFSDRKTWITAAEIMAAFPAT